MFQTLCAHHQEVKVYYTASGIITPLGERTVHRLREIFSQPLPPSYVMTPDYV